MSIVDEAKKVHKALLPNLLHIATGKKVRYTIEAEHHKVKSIRMEIRISKDPQKWAIYELLEETPEPNFKNGV